MKRECVCLRARHEHGSRGAYQYDRCRCFPCRMANHYALASYKAGETWRECDGQLVPSRYPALQLRALMRLGYTARQIADRTGLAESHVQNLRTDHRHPMVSTRLAERVDSAFAALWDKPAEGPEGNRQRTRARKLGYPLPLEIEDVDYTDPGPVIDEVAVERRIKGDHQPLTIPELAEAVLILHGKGWSETAIAKRLRMSGTRVTQIIDRDEAA